MKIFLFFLVLFLFFTSGCVDSPKAELSAADTDVSINVLSNEHRILNISILVHNTGEADAKNVLVTAEAQPLNEAGEEIMIGSFTIPNIPPRSEALAYIRWDTKKTYRDNMLRLTIDPMNSVEEYDDANNVVMLSYAVR